MEAEDRNYWCISSHVLVQISVVHDSSIFTNMVETERDMVTTQDFEAAISLFCFHFFVKVHQTLITT